MADPPANWPFKWPGTNDPREHFDCLGTIGRGSYGSVFRARERDSKALVAIKVVPMDPNEGTGASGTASAADEARRELELLQSCDSPHVLACKCSLRHDDRLWIVTELCEGGSLIDVMRAHNAPLAEMQVAAAMGCSLQGLCYLHGQKMLHRDVKAGNLLLTRDGSVKLGDLGISVQLGSTMARRMTIIGTPHWLAPEVIGSDAGYDTAADIWSLGITAIELAEMHPPHWDVEPMMRALFKITSGPPPTLTKPSEWATGFAEWLSLCLQKEPAERSSAPELLAHGFIQMTAIVDPHDVQPDDLRRRVEAQRKQALQPLAERGVRATTLAAEATTDRGWGNLDARRAAEVEEPSTAAPAAPAALARAPDGTESLDPRLNPDLSLRGRAPPAGFTAGRETLDPRLNPDLSLQGCGAARLGFNPGTESLDPLLNPDLSLRGGDPRLQTNLSELDTLRPSKGVAFRSTPEGNTVCLGRAAAAPTVSAAVNSGAAGGGTLVLPPSGRRDEPEEVGYFGSERKTAELQLDDVRAALKPVPRGGTQEPAWLRDAADRLAESATAESAPKGDSEEPQWLRAAAAGLSSEAEAPTERASAPRKVAVEMQTQTSPAESENEPEQAVEEEWETEAGFTNQEVDENHKSSLFPPMPPGVTPSDALLAKILAEAAEAELAAAEVVACPSNLRTQIRLHPLKWYARFSGGRGGGA